MNVIPQFIRKHIIIQVLLATLPFLTLGMAVSVHIFHNHFSAINEIGIEIRNIFQQDILELENSLAKASDLNLRYAARITAFESQQNAEAVRNELLKQGLEHYGRAKYAAAELVPHAVHQFSGQKRSPQEILTSVRTLFDDLLLESSYWNGSLPLASIIPQGIVSEDLVPYANDVLTRLEPDWFEDQFSGRDVLFSLVPATADRGLFIFVFDVSQAYSYFDRADRAGLSLGSARIQEERFLKAKARQDQFRQQRVSQSKLIDNRTELRDAIFSNTQTNLLIFSALNLVALISTSIFLFWFLATRKISALNNWLKRTSLAVCQLPSVNETHHSLTLGNPGDTAGNPGIVQVERFFDPSPNEIGELSRNINYLLSSLEQTTVSKNLLSQEIEERKKIETVLRESQKRLNTIFNSVQSGVVIVDFASNRILDLNPAALAMFQAPKDDVIGQMHDLFFVHGLNSPADGQQDWQRENNNEFILQPVAGEPFSVLKTDRRITLDGRDILISNFISIEDIKRSRQQLEKAKQAAEQASKVKTSFLANMSHEIRTPLNGVIGMTQLFSETRLNTDQQRICQTILAEADSLLKIINEILDFSKIEAGKMDLEEVPFNLNDIIEQVTENIAMRIPQKCLEAFAYIPATLPTTVSGDPGRLQQVLTNLGNNALKFTTEGQIFISVETLEESADHIEIKFVVQDTGIGISDAKQKTIFESFTQADGSTTRKYGGTGLGTTIAKQLVELMGGSIGLKSCEKVGTTFWFTIPFQKVRHDEGGTTAGARLAKTGLTVLVVDDNATSCLILERYLRSLDCDVRLASNCDNALQQLRDHGFDLLITDYNMPEKTGLDLVQQLRNEPEQQLRNLPVIILSSYHSADSLLKARDLKIQGLLRKPVKRNELCEALNSALNYIPEKPSAESVQNDMAFSEPLLTSIPESKSILLVEDYPTNQQIALRFLTSSGYRVDIAENGIEAIEAVQKKDYDLILMDIQMPEMDGYTATRHIRDLAGGGKDSLPIIAMTAHATTGYREQCLAADMNDYISKPIRKEQFLRMVDAWILRQTTSSTADIPDHTWNEDIACFDHAKALESFMGDKEFLAEVVNGFLDKLDSHLQSIKSGLSQKSFADIAAEAHTVKGGAYNLNATRLAQTAALLEKAALNENASECRLCLAEMEGQVQKLIHFTAHIWPSRQAAPL